MPEPEQDNSALARSETNTSADSGEMPAPSKQSRSQIRAALNSMYHTSRNQVRPEIPPATTPTSENTETEQTPEIAATPAAPEPAIDPVELERAAEVQAFIAQAQVAARQKQPEAARKLLAKAIQRDPQNSEAWTWLGGLFLEANLHYAKLCLTKALEFDTDNERAKRGLEQVEKRLEEKTKEQPGALVPTRQDIQIGLEEALTELQKSGKPADPQSIPRGGALIRPAVERGELKQPKFRRAPFFRLTGFALSMTILICFGIIGLTGTGFAVVASLPTATAAPTTEWVAPTYTPAPLSIDETFAGSLRGEMDKYIRIIGTIRSLRLQVQQEQIDWPSYRQALHRLQAESKENKKLMDNLAVSATPLLLNYYRDLQTIAAITNQALDFTINGADNTNPEDLEEGNRQLNEALRRMADLTRRLNSASPVPTVAPTPTPLPTATPSPVPTETPLPTATAVPTSPLPTTVPPLNVDIAGPATPVPTQAPTTLAPTPAPTLTVGP